MGTPTKVSFDLFQRFLAIIRGTDEGQISITSLKRTDLTHFARSALFSKPEWNTQVWRWFGSILQMWATSGNCLSGSFGSDVVSGSGPNLLTVEKQH